AAGTDEREPDDERARAVACGRATHGRSLAPELAVGAGPVAAHLEVPPQRIVQAAGSFTVERDVPARAVGFAAADDHDALVVDHAVGRRAVNAVRVQQHGDQLLVDGKVGHVGRPAVAGAAARRAGATRRVDHAFGRDREVAADAVEIVVAEDVDVPAQAADAPGIARGAAAGEEVSAHRHDAVEAAGVEVTTTAGGADAARAAAVEHDDAPRPIALVSDDRVDVHRQIAGEA